MSKTIKTIFWTAGILLLIGVATGIYFFNKKVPGLKHVTPDFTLTADELYNEFLSNETAALRKYQDKVVSISGEVLSVVHSEDGSNVMLHAENALANGINCSFRDRISHITKGQRVTIKGRCQGILMDVIINNCYAE